MRIVKPGRCKVAEVFVVVLGRIKVADGDVVIVTAVQICFVVDKISCILTSPSWLGSIVAKVIKSSLPYSPVHFV